MSAAALFLPGFHSSRVLQYTWDVERQRDRDRQTETETETDRQTDRQTA
jgi:hypothetical protein